MPYAGAYAGAYAGSFAGVCAGPRAGMPRAPGSADTARAPGSAGAVAASGAGVSRRTRWRSRKYTAMVVLPLPAVPDSSSGGSLCSSRACSRVRNRYSSRWSPSWAASRRRHSWSSTTSQRCGPASTAASPTTGWSSAGEK
ncbi:MAG: hypothetical protein OXC12_14195 [Spirochaetaceae bacterium]|nr:hypothetical protein [Spirochaetaceae bacterium]